MNTPMHLEFEKTRINLWHVGTLVVGLLLQAFTAGVLYTQMNTRIDTLNERMEGADKLRASRIAMTDAAFAAIDKRLEPFDTMVYRQAQQDAKIDAVNARLDRIVESFGGKLDTANDSISMLRSDVRVLSSKVDLLQQATKPAVLRR